MQPTPLALGLGCSLLVASLAHAERPRILLTGYWPPSNEAVRPFSQSSAQNPGGWIGGNWEDRGYDIVSYFPEFVPANCTSCGIGSGDLQVDYQDTSADFWAIAEAVKPVAIITFSRGFINRSWELEMNQFNRTNWLNDYLPPLLPTPSPPDASVPAGTLRLSTLPVQAIVDAVAAEHAALVPYVCFTQDGGGFLSEFIAYHGVWYQSLHADPSDPNRCVAAGHIHVGGLIDWPTAQAAAETSLRVLTDHLDDLLYAAEDLDRDGSVGSADLAILLGAFGPCPGQGACDADLDGDGAVTASDIAVLLGAWSA
jgi:hypothetical protein